MRALVVLTLSLAAPAAAAAQDGVALPSTAAAVAPREIAGHLDGQDTTRKRARAIEVSDWYNRRLRIHRIGAYATIPVFGLQYLAGRQLWDKSSAAPDWARNGHRIGATTLAGIFAANTVTGVWNLWDSRSVEQHKALRYAHAAMMLAADAGFTYAGAKLSEDAETDADKRALHRTIALSSIGVTAASGLMMKLLNK